jgi:F-type H+-transporting ATPase subunit a
MSLDLTIVLGAGDPVAHVANHKFIVADLLGIKDLWLWSGHIGNLVLSGLILCILGPWAASKIATGPESEGSSRYVTRNRLAHMIEVLCVYLREEVVRPLLGSQTDRMMPFLWTLFFFIWVNNLLGMIPLLDLQHIASGYLKSNHLAVVGGTATQSLFVTAVLAVISFLVINFAGIRSLGVGGYLHHLTGGAPFFIWPIIVPVEIVGTFVKPFALAIRLFANMTAGHILLATLLGFMGTALATLAGAKDGSFGLSIAALVGAGAGAIAIFFLEVFVATLQAFVFMFLTTVFISQLAHHDHEHDEHHGHEHAHA